MADSMIDFDLDCDSSHKFPRKYLTKRNLAFKKSHRVYEQMELSLDVHSCDTQLKELKTREQSLRTNIPTDDDLQPSLLTLPGDWLLMIESRLDKQIE